MSNRKWRGHSDDDESGVPPLSEAHDAARRPDVGRAGDREAAVRAVQAAWP